MRQPIDTHAASSLTAAAAEVSARVAVAPAHPWHHHHHAS